MDWWWRSPDCLDFLIGMCSITQVGLCVGLVGVFSAIPYRLICSSPLGSLHHRRAWRPLLLSYVSSSTLAWRVLVDTCSSGMVSLPGEFPGALNRLVTSTLIWTGCFPSPSIFAFFCGAPAGGVSVVPYSLRSMVCWRFSVPIASLPIVLLDA